MGRNLEMILCSKHHAYITPCSGAMALPSLLLHILAWSLTWHALVSAQQCLTEMMSNGCGMHSNEQICSWEQGLLRSKTMKDYTTCSFVVRDPAFLEILSGESKLELVAEAEAHEGGVYNPDDDCFYFSSSSKMHPKPNSEIMKMHLGTGKVESIVRETEVANGMTLGKEGELLVCHQGIRPSGGFIERLNITTLKSSIIADNWHGRRLNSPNDIIIKSDGSIWFTDPDYAWVQGFGEEPELNNHIYRVSPTGEVDVVADGFVKPNGLAFSHDEKLLYVTDTGSTIGGEGGKVERGQPYSISVMDVGEDGVTLLNKRLFAAIATMVGPSYKGVGCPDGIKVDTTGRVYVANPDGVQVISPKGKLLGLIKVPGASNMGFAGKDLNMLIILNDKAIYKVGLSAQGAGLHYASHKLEKSHFFS
ncbi:hypothetical protein GOP47_0009180 [Adiantum capillus-veneris]|uniref:SMP-30/Gluconolactonase/LRE-like region domain-containing protein n=1 Tax=Adiantum capillus-veneris TaxID=13818 RepID=A0A9D4UWF0_ADICA|nr:hypothetical protein GOP47_0009180 [Adiantum capillus-veneris]